MVGTRPDNRAFDALANTHRRRLLFALFDTDQQADDGLEPLDLLTEGQTTDDPAATRVELRHCHLPKLADMEFIEWDRESGELSKGSEWNEIAPLLRLICQHRGELPDEWPSELTDDA